MNITMKMKNEMIQIIGRIEKRIGDKIYSFGKVKDNGRIKLIYVGMRESAPNPINTISSIS
jgi:hypothetical protein